MNKRNKWDNNLIYKSFPTTMPFYKQKEKVRGEIFNKKESRTVI